MTNTIYCFRLGAKFIWQLLINVLFLNIKLVILLHHYEIEQKKRRKKYCFLNDSTWRHVQFHPFS